MRVDDLGAAVQSPDDGWLDPYSVLAALRRKTRALGVELIQDEVVALDRSRLVGQRRRAEVGCAAQDRQP